MPKVLKLRNVLRPRFQSDSSSITILSGNEVLAEIIPTVINATDAALARFQPTDRNCYTDQVSIPPTSYEQLFCKSVFSKLFCTESFCL